GLELARMDRPESAAEDLGVLCSGSDADGQGTGQKVGKPDEAGAAKGTAYGGHDRAAAEIEEIDDEEIRNAAQHRRIGAGDASQEGSPGDLGPSPKSADDGADEETRDRDRHRHQRAQGEGDTPAIRAKAYQLDETGRHHGAESVGVRSSLL